MKKIKYLLLGSIGGVTIGYLASSMLKSKNDTMIMPEKMTDDISMSLNDLLERFEEIDFQSLSKSMQTKIKKKIEKICGLWA